MSKDPFLRRIFTIYRLFREDRKELQNYLADEFATRVVHPSEYASGVVLDAGCQWGGFMEAFRRGGAASVIGLDIHHRPLVEGNVPAGLVGDMTQAPLADKSFDLVYARGVIEHVPDQLAFCRECHRILKVGGYVCISTSPWYAPHAGHDELRPFHTLPFGVAKWVSERVKGIKIQATDLAGLGLYPITIGRLKNMMLQSGFELTRMGDAFFERLDWLAYTPLGEILTQHVFVVGQRVQ